MISKNQIKFYSSLKEKKNREQEGLFLIEGVRLCEEALATMTTFEAILFSADFPRNNRSQKIIGTAQAQNILCEEIPNKSLLKIADTKNPQGVVAVVKKTKTDFTEFLNQNPRLLIALFEINDPGNLGTILRTANWFGTSGVLISSDSVEFTNPKVVRASMGAVFHLPVFKNIDFGDALTLLKKSGYSILLADSNAGTNFYEVTFPEKTVLILGGETAKIPENIKKLTDAQITIPGSGKSDSLNVAIAAGILLSETNRKRTLRAAQ